MRTRILLLASLLVGAMTMQAQTVTADGHEYTVDDLWNGGFGFLKNVTSITINEGEWSDGALRGLHNALISEGTNTKLTTVVFKPEAIILDMSQIFQHCVALESVTMPTIVNNAPVSFEEAFQGCVALKSEIDLTSFTNITHLGNTFQGCQLLPAVKMPITSNDNVVWFTNTFGECHSLASTIDLRGFIKVYSYLGTFAECTHLENIYLGTAMIYDPSWIDNKMDETFNGCTENCNVYLPEGVTEIPGEWAGKFAVKFILYNETAINTLSVATDAIPALSHVYTVDGRLVKTVPAAEYGKLTDGLDRGIYMVNGKKVAVE